jgi:chorismate mutase
MNQLNLLNHVIANCDEALVEAFVRRMDISSEVAKAKLSMDENVYDSKTEREYIQHVVSQFSPELSLKANSLWYSLLRMDRGQQFRWILKHTENVAPAHEALITDSLPEGLVACIDKYADEASQMLGCDVIRCTSNDEALQMLKAKLYDIKQREQTDKIASQRKSQVGTGDRSERIRTYNYPQGRITDHRIGFSIFTMESFLNGDIDAMIDALISADTAEKLKNAE